MVVTWAAEQYQLGLQKICEMAWIVWGTVPLYSAYSCVWRLDFGVCGRRNQVPWSHSGDSTADPRPTRIWHVMLHASFQGEAWVRSDRQNPGPSFTFNPCRGPKLKPCPVQNKSLERHSKIKTLESRGFLLPHIWGFLIEEHGWWGFCAYLCVSSLTDLASVHKFAMLKFL